MAKLKTIPKRLTGSEIETRLKSLKGWHYVPDQKAISIECKMKDFMAVVRKIRKIAKLAEKADHHPDLHLTGYKHLKVVLSTHAAGGVTEKDFSLAKKINVKAVTK